MSAAGGGLTDDRRRAVALLVAGLRGDHAAMEAMLAGVLPTARSFDTDPLGWAADQKRFDPVAAMVGELLRLAAEGAIRQHGSAVAAAAWLESDLRELSPPPL
ncbi:hypothetical protein SAMN05660657_04299 [Geodermatophilus amargosae]|uniref:Uncharacterized protein n=1 Tax=Geodermatophilus amargosae TaxID=1296565 RepID=A0A1I7CBY8_9ACTN|nr:hypothetical protein [Geodermatophilus amargosae]SFT96926.1 hypothetical protein SAMN05660657_04299 [Geodermatophilus amargosae]